ncbi:hypothetical protein [Pseudomonas sp. NBRC 100443]|uniref:hypothetical protein n=1 Tax=Pseudomonas sp. NBRC 100443 TaxID=1113665 RepID=UPI0024A0213F|nr:hypothetical protein [Pseudomonas sp. NBRC 100443]GLU37150.1 hypothetical protein Pssp01_12430 [Pseudomonas sp. NBRC 100443]
MTAATRAALETKVTSSAIQQFEALISCQSPFAPVDGLTVEDCLDGSSNLLAGCVHLTRLITDGDPEDAEQSAYCLSFLLEGAKALLDSANTQLNKGSKP